MNNNSKNIMYMVWSIAIVLCLLLVLFALLFSTVSSARLESPEESVGVVGVVDPENPDAATGEPADPDAAAGQEGPDATQAPAVPDYELGETEDAGTEYLDKLIFLGDSTTNGLREYGVLTDGTGTKQVWTPASGTLTLAYWSTATIVFPDTGEEISIQRAVELKKPEYLVITLGVNGVSFMNEEYFKEQYAALIDAVLLACPTVKIICNSIYPVTNDYKNLDAINNTNIPAANGWIRQLCQDKGVKFLNTAPVLMDSDGSLKQEYCNGDGIHLSTEGFNQVLKYFRTHAYL